jgi:SulP family sulfate permease
MRKVMAMDATGLNALEDLYERLHHKSKHLLLSGPHTQPLLVMDKSGFLDRIGRENVCAHIDAALDRAREILGLPPATPTDPNHEEKRRLEAVRQELADVLEKVQGSLKSPSSGAGSAAAQPKRADTTKTESRR